MVAGEDELVAPAEPRDHLFDGVQPHDGRRVCAIGVRAEQLRYPGVGTDGISSCTSPSYFDAIDGRF